MSTSQFMTMNVKEIEKRFLEVTGVHYNLNKFPLEEKDCQRVKIDKDKSNLHGEVFTPLWFVDKMILKKSPGDLIKGVEPTHDLCAGYGQFTIRLLRFLANKKKGFKPEIWLRELHSFSEYQVESACKLLYIFGTDIDLFIGDAVQLTRLDETDKGTLVYIEDKEIWFNITEYIKPIFDGIKEYSYTLEKKFVKKLKCVKKSKKKEIKKLANIKRCKKEVSNPLIAKIFAAALSKDR